jgi:hypothetical protein
MQGRHISGFAVLATRRKRAGSGALSKLYWQLPGYRRKWALETGGRYFNRGEGAFLRCWIVGTQPFAFAFLGRSTATDSSTKPYSGDSSSDVGSRTGLDVVKSAAGADVLTDKRQREPAFVNASSLCAAVDTVIVYPQNLQLTPDGVLTPDPSGQPALHARLVHLTKPESLDQVIASLAEATLAQRASVVEDIPIRTR